MSRLSGGDVTSRPDPPVPGGPRPVREMFRQPLGHLLPLLQGGDGGKGGGHGETCPDFVQDVTVIAKLTTCIDN